MSKKIVFEKFVTEFDKFVRGGFCHGAGDYDENYKGVVGQVCVEQAVSCSLGLDGQRDAPKCVNYAVARAKIRLNDALWHGNEPKRARARALRNVGIAQVGSKSIRGLNFSKLSKLVLNELSENDKEALGTCLAGGSLFVDETAKDYYEGVDISGIINWADETDNSNDNNLTKIKVIKALYRVLVKLKSPGVVWLEAHPEVRDKRLR